MVPSVDPDFADACTATLPDPDRVLRLDNRGERNRGVAASWNLGIDLADQLDAEWLTICAESIRFSDQAAGWEHRLAGIADARVVRGSCDRDCRRVFQTGAGSCRYGYGWHLIALRRSVWETVGRFDERFHPAWYEDCDYQRRMALAGFVNADTATAEGVAAHLVATEHSLACGAVTQNWGGSAEVYRQKWGGDPGWERFDRPYGNPAYDFTYAGPRPDTWTGVYR